MLEQQILNQKDTGYATSVSGSLLDILLVSREVFRESTPWCLIKNLVKKFKRHHKHSILGCKSVSHEGRTPAKHQTFAKRHPFREQFRGKQSHTAKGHRTSMGHTFFRCIQRVRPLFGIQLVAVSYIKWSIELLQHLSHTTQGPVMALDLHLQYLMISGNTNNGPTSEYFLL